MTHMEAVSYVVLLIYLFSFVMLTAASARSTGRSPWIFAKGAISQTVPATLFRVSFVGAALWPLARWLFGDPIATDPIRAALDGTIGDVVGHAMMAVGACVAIVSQLHMGTSWRVGAAEGEVGAIVDNGPFAISRNPVFVGQMLLFVGLFLVLPGVIQALLTAALLVAVHLQVRIEETVLVRELGAPYVAYCQRVRRWLGRKSQRLRCCRWL